MKLIKKIAAMLFAFAMVFSMGTNVKAEGTGKITIDPAKAGETYNVYKILTLQSYDKGKGLYSYVKNGDKWDEFINSAQQEGYLTINNDGYVEFDAKKSDKDYREFAQKALAYAKKNNVTATQTVTPVAGATTATIDKLDLGYYLVGSTVGALCSLDTTNPEVTVRDKNEAPTVEKKIAKDGHTGNLVPNNSANIGEQVVYQTTINVKPGAKNYVLHDTMDSHLDFDGILQAHLSDGTNLTNGDYVVQKGPADKCTFDISFTDVFYNKYRSKIDDGTISKIIFQYSATVKDDAVINEPMKNTTHLTYGDNNTSTTESKTITKTFGIPVFKYTGTNTPLAGAEFKLYTDSNCNEESTALKFTLNDSKYRYDSAKGNAVLTSLENTGHIDIEGLKEGTYYLKETKAPKGYNLLKNPVEIRIDSAGKIYVDGSTKENTGNVEVKNNSGTLLPSTGGMGTTLIYLAGIVLVVLSGYVLISKRRASTK